jgi:nucleoside-diphosphate-sugar epimerase
MKLFLLGASGYIGGSVALALLRAGHQLVGLARTEEKGRQLATLGIQPVIGTLDSADVIAQSVRETDGVINAADSDHRFVVETIAQEIRGTDKVFIHTSGSSIVADPAAGEPSNFIYDEETEFEPDAHKLKRVEIDRFVRSIEGARAIVICPTMIYGEGHGLNKKSVQLPRLVDQARKSGISRVIGRGLNRWSNVHIDDLFALYILALEKAPAGAFYFAENGEESFLELGRRIREELKLDEDVQQWPLEAAIAEWGYEMAVFGLGSNSRVRANRARKELGWKPQLTTILESVLV